MKILKKENQRLLEQVDADVRVLRKNLELTIKAHRVVRAAEILKTSHSDVSAWLVGRRNWSVTKMVVCLSILTEEL